MKHLRLLPIVTAALLLALPALAADTIRIGFNIELTGDIPKVGEASKFAAEMLKAEINGKGGLQVGAKKYLLDFVYEDNEAKAESAVTTALKLIEKDQVLAMIGPNSSKQAIPAGQVADDNKTVMVSPWSTNPDTTKDRPWVYRAAFLDPFQGPVAVNFAVEQFKAKTAAVLYDLSNDYSKGLAEIFRERVREEDGQGEHQGLREPRHQGPGLLRAADQDHRRQARLHLRPGQLQPGGADRQAGPPARLEDSRSWVPTPGARRS